MSASAPHPAELVVPWVRQLAPYVPGKPIAELERELGLRDIIKLASNESPWGPSPLALAAMQRALQDIWLYPDGSQHALRQAVAAQVGVGSECITLGNGSNDLLVLLAEAFLTPQHSAVYSQYGFAIYPIVIRAAGARAIEVPAFAPTAASSAPPMPLGHDVAAMLAAIRADTRLLFIANPNNPTGTWATAAELERAVAAVPPTMVVVDEAYFEYGRLRGTQDATRWLQRYSNLIVLRIFSKAYGLAGARVGYAISHPEVAEVLNRLRPAFNERQCGAGRRAGGIGRSIPCAQRDRVGHARTGSSGSRTGSARAMVRTFGGEFRHGARGCGGSRVYRHLLEGGVDSPGPCTRTAWMSICAYRLACPNTISACWR